MRIIVLAVCTAAIMSHWATLVLAAYSDAVLADRPIGYWRFEETDGTTAFDASGNERHGTYENGVTLGRPGAESIGGFSAEFDGETGFVDLPDTWGGGPEATVEAWVYPTDITGDFQSVVSGHDPNTFVHFQLHTAGNTGVYTDSGFAPTPIIPTEPLDEWRHVAIVTEPGEATIYVDGEILDFPLEFDYENVTESDNVDIGIGHVSTRWFHGRIDEVAIYDKALSQEQLQAHINDVRPPLLNGDINGDNMVNLLDFEIIRDNFRTGRLKEEGDITGDGRVDFRDFGAWKDIFQNQDPQVVPEPGAITLLAYGLAFLFLSHRVVSHRGTNR